MATDTVKKGMLSVIMPAYNEEAVLETGVRTVISVLSESGITFEILIVDDGSSDNTWSIAKRLSGEFPDVRAVCLSRNFGKEAAIYAGLAKAAGDCCILIDSDLQQPPHVMRQMYGLWSRSDIHVVEGRKNSRQKESRLNRFFAGQYYKLLRRSTGIDLRNASDFRLLDRKIIDILCAMPEKHTFFRAISSWVGFNSATVYFDVEERKGGKSKWSFFSLFKLAVDSITSFTSIPMQIVTFFGVGFFIFAVVLTLQALYMKLSGKAFEGFTSVIIILLTVGSVIMISLGIIGTYLSKIYDEVKSRPKYLIKETTDDQTK